MAAKPLPSPEVLRQLLRYEPETGKLFWRERGPEWFNAGNTSAEANCAAWNRRQAGKEALISYSHGYRSGGILGRAFLAHRVIWAIVHGEWPVEQVDHINLDRSDNRISNLRAATSSENKCNTKAKSTNTSGFKGVCWHKQRSRWHAQIAVAGKHKSLGLYGTAEEAHAAYCKAASEIHGSFARVA